MPVKDIVTGQKLRDASLQRARELRQAMTPAEKVEFYVDPHYGQVPPTVYFGVGVGCCGAGGNLSGSKSIYNDDLSMLLPWHWR